MKLKKIFILIALIVLFYTTYAFAVEPQIVIEGENTCRPNETKVLTVKITSETEIGVVSGKIEANENIANMTVTGKNNWNLTYNSETGVFNIYKAEGSKEEEIIDIEYEARDIEGTATITISNIRMTNIAYETEEVSDITKDITIEELKIEIQDYEESKEENGNYIENISPNTTIEDLISKIQTNGNIEIYKGTDKITDANAKIATGMKVKITLNNQNVEYTAVVKGDLTGDGEMGDADLLRMARYKAGLDTNLTGAYLKAADINDNDDKADDIDLLKLVRILVGLDWF